LHPSFGEAVFLTIAALFAGTLDAIAGGGGLICVPALFSIPSLAPFPHLVLGTNKGQSVFGAIASLARYAHSGLVDRARAPVGFVLGMIGAVLGSRLALALSPDRLKPIVVVTVGVAAVYLTFRKSGTREPGRKPRHVAAAVAALVIGAYDGLIGPGTGTFLIVAFVALLGESMQEASANAKVVNFGSNLAAFATFAYSGKIVWAYALPMAGSQLVGGVLGAHIAVKVGDKLVRRAVLLVSLALIAKVVFDTVRAHS
jgi:uncharacterized protein